MKNFSAQRVVDATDFNWAERLSPAWFLPYVQMSRWDRPIGWWLLLIPCWWGLLLALNYTDQPTWFDLWIFLGCLLGAILMRGAGCTWNDLTDHQLDANVARTQSRPLPSGRIARPKAYLWLAIQSLLALAILVTFNPFTIVLGLASLVPVAIYPFAKRFTWWPQIFLGIAFNWGALLGWAAHVGSLSLQPVLLYLAGMCWTLFYDTIYAHQDSLDDRLTGIKSTALLFGHKTRPWLIGFMLAIIILLLWATYYTYNENLDWIGLTVAFLSVFAFGLHLVWQLTRLDIDSPSVCLHLFRANRGGGLLFVAGLAISLLF